MSPRASRRFVLVLAAGLAAGVDSLPARAADGPAASLIEKVSLEVIQIIKTTTGAPREAAIRKVMEHNFDMPYMAQQALGTHWGQANDQQHERYLTAVVSAEAHAYAERFGEYGGQTLTIGRVTQRPNGVSVVDSKLNQTNGQPISIQWEVRDGGQGARISDVKIEGVSMVMTRRSDFNSYIQNHGGQVEPLIKELEARASH